MGVASLRQFNLQSTIFNQWNLWVAQTSVSLQHFVRKNRLRAYIIYVYHLRRY